MALTHMLPETQVGFNELAAVLETQLQVKPPNTSLIRALQCRDWQELKLAILGLTYEQKRRRLTVWVLEDDAVGGSTREQRVLQVLDYIYLLRRAGVLFVPSAGGGAA